MRKRVLNNETIKDFKKELHQIIEYTFAPGNESKVHELISFQLSQIVSKSQQEIFYMMKRMYLVDRKNKKRTDIEREATLVKTQIERELKSQNQRSQSHNLLITQLNPKTFVFQPSHKLIDMCKNLCSVISEHIKVFNDYSKSKFYEEKARTKKPKLSHEQTANAGKLYEQLDEKAETIRIVKELSNYMPVKIRHRIHNQYLARMFAVPELPPEIPPRGNIWHKVKVFYEDVDRNKQLS